MTKKTHHSNRLYVVMVVYRSGADRLLVFETRADARDFAGLRRDQKNVLSATIWVATRGPSNLKTSPRTP